MAHLLRDFRGKVDLVYVDPPFGSNARYGSYIHPKGRPVYPLLFTFGETRFVDVWSRDEYLQFMYERLILIRELLSEKGSLFVHCDRCSQHLLRCLLCMPSENPLFTGFEVHSVPSGQEDSQPEGDVDVAIADGRLVIRGFCPEKLIRKLNVGHDFFDDWRHLADSVYVDWHYDGKVFRPSVADLPAGDALVKGGYSVPEDAGVIRIRIVDVLSEAFDVGAQA